MSIKILIVDDHPLQIEGYKSILQYNIDQLEIETTVCYNCEEAYTIIVNTEAPLHFDIVFLDRSLPPYPEKKIFSGEDLALLTREYSPKSKIMVLTSHAEAFVIYDLVQKVRPDGVLIKSDFDGDELLAAFSAVLNGAIYYSQTVKDNIKELLSRENYLDTINRQIIFLLSQGLKNKTIALQLNLSDSAIEKRKSKLKDFFFISKGTDEELVQEARKMGFI
jgi:DNA-binding NarL/FixJ family response regulator